MEGMWDECHTAHALAEREVVPGEGSWSRHAFGFHVPPGHDQVGFIVCLAGAAGGKLWLDDAVLARR